MASDERKPETVLVVDDDPTVLEMVCSILESGGYRVLRAVLSDAALDICTAYQEVIDLIVADVKMDRFMTGFELAQCIRLMRVEIKVLYISGFAEDKMVRGEVENGVAGFLHKPFNTETLLEKVRDILK